MLATSNSHSPTWPVALLLGLVFCLSTVGAAIANTNKCTRAQAIAAEQDATDIPDWRTLRHVYGRYRQCDDAAIAEGFSDAVVNLLINKWDDLERDGPGFLRNRGLRRFILIHVDILMSEEEFNAIRHRATSCGTRLKSFCVELNTRLDRVNDEAREEARSTNK